MLADSVSARSGYLQMLPDEIVIRGGLIIVAMIPHSYTYNPGVGTYVIKQCWTR